MSSLGMRVVVDLAIILRYNNLTVHICCFDPVPFWMNFNRGFKVGPIATLSYGIYLRGRGRIPRVPRVPSASPGLGPFPSFLSSRLQTSSILVLFYSYLYE